MQQKTQQNQKQTEFFYHEKASLKHQIQQNNIDTLKAKSRINLSPLSTLWANRGDEKYFFWIYLPQPEPDFEEEGFELPEDCALSGFS